jgi:hypothetical protein
MSAHAAGEPCDDEAPIEDTPFMVTLFLNQSAQSKTERKMPLAELAELIRRTHAPTKAELPWLKLGFFGDKRTGKNCLRSNANLRWVSGIEADYDGERVSFDRAVNVLWNAGAPSVWRGRSGRRAVRSLVYTSASHTWAKPRWRVLCPFDLGRQPDQRNKYLARLNGLFGGVFSGESWTLSQGYLFGRADTPPQPGDIVEAVRCVEIDGTSIDLMDDLDGGAIWKATTKASGGVGTAAGEDAEADAELIRQIVTGEVLHPALCAMAARLISRGQRADTAAETLRGLMLATPEAARDERWRHRYGQIPSLVDSAVPKFADDEKREKRKALAKMLFRMVRQQATQEKIEAAAFAEGERLGLSRADVCHVATWAASKGAA